MNIGIDTRVFNYKIIGGIGLYTYNILKHLLQIDLNDFFISFQKFPNPTYNSASNNHKIVYIPWLERFKKYQYIWEDKLLPYFLKKMDVDIFHSPDHFLPASPMRCKKIVTIHDVAPFAFPETKTAEDNKKYIRKMQHSSMNADLVLTVSEFSKSEIVKYLCIGEEKISVIYPGLNIRPDSDIMFRSNDQQNIELPENYLLHVGTIEPRKNIRLLADLMKVLEKTKYSNYYLVLVGSDGWLYEELYKYIELIGCGEKIIRLRNVNNELLRKIYAKARAVVVPSLYEGFGFPVIEAMSSGVPVIASNCSAIPEVMGDGGILFNNESAEDLFYKLLLVLNDVEFRNNIIEKGRERARRFTWQTHAAHLLSAYRSLYQN